MLRRNQFEKKLDCTELLDHHFCSAVVAALLGLFRVQVDGHDQAVETEDLSENKNENHANKESRLLGCSADSSVAEDANGVTGSQAGQADGETGTKMSETSERLKNCLKLNNF